jgi:hypothetical protein
MLAMVPATASAAPPTLRVRDIGVTEIDAGTAVVKVPVSLSAASSRRVSVQFQTRNGTAKAPADYVTTTGTVVFAPGVTTAYAPVRVKGDLLDENNETFTVKILNPVRASIADSTGIVTIRDDDPLPRLTAGDVSKVEGQSGVTTMTVPVTLNRPSGRSVSVSYAVSPGTATVDTDYTGSASGTLTFPVGATARTIPITLVSDLVDEQNETVNVALVAPVNAAIADGTAVGTIRDDDGPGITITNVAKNESWVTNPYVFTVNLSAASVQAVTVQYATANGTAAAGSDYVSTSGTLTFAPGQTNQTVTVNATGDLNPEANETFVVNLSNPVNATIVDGQGLGTLVNDDATSTDEGRGAALYLGAVSGDTGGGASVVSRFDSILLGDADWYRINLNENDFAFLSPEDLLARIQLTVTDNPAQTSGDIDMRIYRANGTEVGGSFAGGTTDEVYSVRYADNASGFFEDPTGNTFFFVKVYGLGNILNTYTLTVTGDVTAGTVGTL